MSFLPDWVIQLISTVMFLIGAIILFRAAPRADEEEQEQEEEYAAKATDDARAGLQCGRTSFLVLFAAEWGDLSQILTLNLVAKYGSPLSVFVGAWLALLTVSGLAVALRPGAAALPASCRSCTTSPGSVCLVLRGRRASYQLVHATLTPRQRFGARGH